MFVFVFVIAQNRHAMSNDKQAKITVAVIKLLLNSHLITVAVSTHTYELYSTGYQP